MRRSALGSDQGPTEEEQSYGGYQPGTYRNGVEPQDPSQVSFPFLRRIRRDHMIAMGSHFIEMDALSAPWWYDGDDARVQAYADKLIRPIYVDLMQAIFRWFWAGYSPGVKNFMTAQPNWTYYEDGVAKKVWDNGTIDAIVYESIIPLTPETSRITFANGKFSGIQYDGRYGPTGLATTTPGSFIIGGQATPNIDKMHAWWAVHGQMSEDNSPYGFPRIAHAAPIFYMFRWIWDLVGRGFENSFDPGPVVRFPREDADTLSAEGERTKNAAVALQMGSKRRTGSTIALPSDVYRDFQERFTSVQKWAIEYPKADTNFDAVMEFIGYLEAAKLNALFLPEQSLTEGKGGSSSRNVASEFGDQRSTSQNVVLAQAHKFIDDVFVKPIIQMVFPLYQGELTLKSMGAGSTATDLLRQVFQLVGQQDFKRFGIDMRRLAESNGFPMLDPAEQQAELERIQKEAADIANANTPPVEPTQGRRALVTQTGFGEFQYHRLGGHVTLSDDGDFVASLPRVDAFANVRVVKSTRALRAVVQRYLDWAYADFTRALSRKSILADDSAATLRAWLPSTEKIEAHAVDLSREVAAIGRAAGADLGSWADVLAGHLLDQATDDLYENLAGLVDVGLSLDQDGKALAADVRSHAPITSTIHSSMMARHYALRAYNRATLVLGQAEGVKHVIVVDGCHDDRHGEIMTLAEANDHDVELPSCSMCVRLLPRAPEGLTVRHEVLEGDVGAMYDQETETILVDPSAQREDEAGYMLALAERFT